MSESEWAFPVALQPQPDLVAFDLDSALASMVRLRSEVSPRAFSAAPLGTDRLGNGIAIDIGGQRLVVTVGHITLEAEQVWMTTHTGKVIPGHALAFDEITGLGIVMPLAPLNIPTRNIGNSTHLDHHSELWIMGFGGVAHCVAGQLQGRRNFAGFWEYLLSDGLMVTPMHPEFGGAALLDPNGKLVGVGALALHDPNGNARHNSTLFVPADSIPALVERVMRTGKANLRSQPWLGVYATDHQGEVVIMDVAANGPAAQAKLRQGDQITMVNTEPVQDLIHFYRLLWQHEAGSVIELGIKRKTRQRKLPVLSTSRDAFFHKPVRH